MAWCGTSWRGVELHGVVWYFMAWCGTSWRGVVLHGVVWYSMRQKTLPLPFNETERNGPFTIRSRSVRIFRPF